MTPYHEERGVTIYNCKADELLASLPARSADLVFTDPPYLDRTHAKARSSKRRTAGAEAGEADELLDFPPASVDDLDRWFDGMSRIARRWIVATVDLFYAARLDEYGPEGASLIRIGALVKRNPTPQFTGDRPGQGWEAIAMLHRRGAGRMHWNGGGRSSVFIHNAVKRPLAGNGTQKPLAFAREIVELFSEPGELVVDPFIGSGTFLRAALDLGRRAIGCDEREQECETAAKRLAQGAMLIEYAAAGDD